MDSPFKDQTVTILLTSEGAIDDDGVPTPTTTSFSWRGVSVQQQQSDEEVDGRTTVITRYRVSGPPQPTITALSTLEWRGDTYRIEGEPDTRTGPLRINYTRLLMTKVSG